MGYAFISYSSKNYSDAESFRVMFKRNGIASWMAPNDIPIGSKYAQVITQAIKGCDCFVLLLTNDAQNSVWVAKEVERAINHRKTIIPIQLEAVELNEEFELYISSDQIIGVRKIDESSSEIKQVLTAVKAYTGTHDEPEPHPTGQENVEEVPKTEKITSPDCGADTFATTPAVPNLTLTPPAFEAITHHSQGTLPTVTEMPQPTPSLRSNGKSAKKAKAKKQKKSGSSGFLRLRTCLGICLTVVGFLVSLFELFLGGDPTFYEYILRLFVGCFAGAALYVPNVKKKWLMVTLIGVCVPIVITVIFFIDILFIGLIMQI